MENSLVDWYGRGRLTVGLLALYITSKVLLLYDYQPVHG